jgi:hypothetical protein
MDVYALIEEWSDPDESIVFFRELPGCFVTAPTTSEAIQHAPGAIADYTRWLKQNKLIFLEGNVSSINVVVKPGEWSLTDHLEHLLKADAHYVGCHSEQVPVALLPVPEEELPLRLIENGRTYEAVLRGLTPFQRTRIYSHGEAEWTAAKALRRMTKHLREHYPWMQEIASQLAPN